MINLKDMIGTMVFSSSGNYIVGGTERQNAEFQRRCQNKIDINLQDCVELTCVKESVLTSENYNDIMQVKGMSKRAGIDTNSKPYQDQAEVRKQRDSVEISSAAYGRHATEKTMSATSGKDVLGITKGDTDHSFVIHFPDSAIVSRAVSRGYITVNGVELKLSEETKQQLLEVDEQANAEREKAYNDYVMQHEMAVAKQQSETLKSAFGNVADTIDIFEEFFGTRAMSKQYETALKAYENSKGGVSWSQFEWKTFDTQMKVSVGDTIKIEDISKGEIH